MEPTDELQFLSRLTFCLSPISEMLLNYSEWRVLIWNLLEIHLLSENVANDNVEMLIYSVVLAALDGANKQRSTDYWMVERRVT